MENIPKIAEPEIFDIPLQLRFIDTDRMNHINHAVYVTYLETCRIEWIASQPNNSPIQDVPLIVANVEIDYIKPITLKDKPRVKMWVSRIGRSSFDFSYCIYEADNEELIYATAKTVIVYYDYEEQTSQPIPDDIREVLNSHLITKS